MTTTLKGEEKLNKIFNQFFVELGYPEIETELTNEFCYYYGQDKITYTLLEMPLSDIGFKNYLKKTYPTMPECSMFIFSLLHELGHHVTMPLFFGSKKWRVCKKRKSIVERMKDTTEEQEIKKQEKYCALYDEAIATKEAVKILIENYDYIVKFEKVWYNAVIDFYKENGVTA